MDFSIIEKESTEFSAVDPSEEMLTPKNRNIPEDSKLYSHATGMPLEQTQQRFSAGLGDKMENETSQLVKATEEEFVREELDKSLAISTDLEQVQNLIDNSLFGNVITSPADAILAGQTQFAREERRALRRSAMITELANEYLQFQNTGTTDTLLEIGDQVLSQGVGELFFNFSGERNDMATEFSSLLFSDKTDEEVIEQAREMFEAMGDQGFFTEENSIYLASFINQLKEGGVGSAALEDSLLGTVDAVSAGVEGVIAAAPLAIVRGLKASSAASKIHKMSNSEAGVDLAVDSIQKGVDPDKAVSEGTAPLLRSGVQDEGDKAPMNLEVVERVEGENQLLQFILEDTKFIGVLTDEEVAGLMPQIKAQYKRAMKLGDRKRLLNVDTTQDGMKNRTVNGYLGRATGKLFKPGSKAAKKLAEKLGGEVVPHQLKDGEVGEVVKVSKSLKQNKLVPATPLDEIDDGLFSSLKSTTSRTAVKLDSILKTNEAQVSRVYKEAEDFYNKSAKSVGRKEVAKVDEVISELNDNPAYFSKQEPFSDSEFGQLYHNKFKSYPSPKVVQYYNDQLRLNDTVWALRADSLLKKAVENSEAMYKVDGDFFRGRQVTAVEGKVYNPKSGAYEDAANFPSGSVLEIADFKDIDGKPVRYVFSPENSSRPLRHQDVLGYNPGGSRVYENSNFFVKQDTKRTYGDGTEAAGKPRTFMATVTEKEARKATAQLNAIIKFIRSKVGDSSFDEVMGVKGNLLNDPDFIKVVEDNSDWNLGMEPEDLFDFAEEWDINLSRTVDFAPDGEPLIGSRIGGGATQGEDFLINTSGKRTQKPLVGFGGQPADVLSPSRATEQSFSIALNKAANDAYLRRSAAGWLKAGKDSGLITNLDELTGSLFENMRNAKISETLKGGSKLASERNLIESKLTYQTSDMKKIEQTINKLADFVYDSGAKGISKGLRDPNPVGFMRGMAFNLKLGLFAVDQILVQASQLVNIMGISNNGLRGTLIVPQLRAAMVAPNNKVIKELAKRTAPVSGISPEDFEDILKWIKESGRDLVDQNIIELDGNQGVYKSGWKSLLDAGRVPFNEGELLARIGGMSTAFLDTKAKYPDMDMFSEEARLLITRRQDILTANMTSASGAAWQRSTLSIPTQFMTYSVRMAEQMLSGKVLTPGERVRLALTQSAFWGGAGIVPLGYLTDKWAYHGHSDIDPELFKLARYGMIDYFLSSAFDSETDLSSRLGASGGITSMFEDIMNGTVAEFALGPSGEIGLESIDLVYKTAASMFSGQWDYAQYDFNRLAKTVTSLNRVQSAYLAYSHQQMVSRRSGKVLLENLTPDDALMIGLGIPLKEVGLAFEIYKNSVEHKDYIRKISDEMFTKRNLMIEALDRDDMATAERISEDIAAMYNVLMPYDRKEVARALSRPDNDFFEAMLRREVERGNSQSVMIELAKSLKE